MIVCENYPLRGITKNEADIIIPFIHERIYNHFRLNRGQKAIHKAVKKFGVIVIMFTRSEFKDRMTRLGRFIPPLMNYAVNIIEYNNDIAPNHVEIRTLNSNVNNNELLNANIVARLPPNENRVITTYETAPFYDGKNQSSIAYIYEISYDPITYVQVCDLFEDGDVHITVGRLRMKTARRFFTEFTMNLTLTRDEIHEIEMTHNLYYHMSAGITAIEDSGNANVSLAQLRGRNRANMVKEKIIFCLKNLKISTCWNIHDGVFSQWRNQNVRIYDLLTQILSALDDD